MKKHAFAIFVATGLLTACRTEPLRMNTPAISTTGAPNNFQAFPIYTDRAPRHAHYAPSGYMGDSDLTMSGAYVATPNGQGPCLRVNYSAQGSKGWSGIYWQDPANNWGDAAGRAGYDLRGATALTFWARGENGGERIDKFRVGGIVGQYPDSDVASLVNVRLTKEWKEYRIDLSKKDLRHIIAGFGFFVNKSDNPAGGIFYLDDIFFVGPQGVSSLTSSAPSPTGGQTPSTAPAVVVSSTVSVVAPSAVSVSTKDLNVREVSAGLRVSFSSQLLFSSGKAVLNPGSSKVMDQVAGLLNAYPENKVLIEGHTDNTGEATYNLKLSELRAMSVRDYLIKQGGYKESRFKVTGYGDTKPIASNDTKDGRSLNRRVEVTILKAAKS